MRVLVVDDNADMRDSLRMLLAQIGFDAEGARDGQQALGIQRTRPAQILITDIFMPGTDGIETIEAFRREWPAMKIVAMSGGGAVATRDYLKVAPDIGADAVLRKPFSLDSLQDVLHALVR
ncbi:MAG TPA: response regulator [Burkholderiales bacterium]|nr:response regulator [Burkholderiales bacterium]